MFHYVQCFPWCSIYTTIYKSMECVCTQSIVDLEMEFKMVNYINGILDN